MVLKKRKIHWYLLAGFFGLSAVLIVSGVVFYNFNKSEVQTQRYNELSAISSLKKQQIEKWIRERQSDAFFFYYNPAFHRDAARLGKTPKSAEARETVEGWIYPLYKSHLYRSISLWDEQNTLLCIVGDTTYSAALTEYARTLSIADTTTLSDLYFFDDRIAMDLISNIRVPGAAKSWKLFFHIDPFIELFPLIQTWPTLSRTAESLLLESEGDSVLYLNELRHQKGTALKLKLSGSAQYTAPQMVAKRKTGLSEGIDYRGITVVLNSVKLSHRNWYLVSKVDTEEVYESVDRSLLLIAIFTLVLIGTAGGSVYIYYNQSLINQYREMLIKEQERAEAVTRYETLTRFANDAILIADENAKIIEANLKAEELFGYSKEELLTKNIRELRTSEYAGIVNDFQKRADTGDGIRTSVDYLRKDGTVWTGDVSSKTILIGGQKYFFGIVRDVTEILANRRRIDKLNRFNILLNEINEQIVRVDNEAELLKRTCETAVEHGGFLLVWIGIKTKHNSLSQLAGAGEAVHFLAGLSLQNLDYSTDHSQISRALSSGEVVYINNLPEHPSVIQWKKRIEAAGIGATAGIPVNLNRAEPAFIAFYVKEKDFFYDEEMRLLKRIASNISFAVEKIHLEQKRKEAERQRQISEKNYAAVAANIPQSDVYLFDKERIIQLADGSEMKKFGLGNELYQGRRIDKLLAFETYGLSPDFFSRVLNGEDMKEEIRIQNYVYTINGIPVRDEGGALRGGIALITDISETRRAEEAIIASEEKHRNLINQLPDAVMLISSQGIITFASPAALELFGMTEKNYRTFHFPALVTGRTEEEQVALREEISRGNYVHGEEKFRKLNGEEFYAEFSARQTAPDVVQIVMRDITERKMNEELVKQKTGQLQGFFNSGKYFMGIIELRGEDAYVLMLNDAYAALIGQTPAMLEGKCTRVFASSDKEYEGWKGLLKNCRDTGQSVNIDTPFPIVGEDFYVHASISQIPITGKYDSFSFIAFDISERMRYEKELFESQDSLHKLAVHLQNARENERIAIAREMHDELGQLLTAVKMNVTFLIRQLKKEEPLPKTKETINELEGISSTIDESVKGVRRLITKLRPEVLDNLGLFSAIDWLTEDFRQKTGKIAVFENSAGEPKLGKDISLALFRIVQECITNVIKHAEAESVKITFSKSNGFYLLAIADDGKGFNKGKRKSGKQFGLMGIQERMYIFGGEVSVSSNPGKGTVVTVRLPENAELQGSKKKEETT